MPPRDPGFRKSKNMIHEHISYSWIEYRSIKFLALAYFWHVGKIRHVLRISTTHTKRDNHCTKDMHIYTYIERERHWVNCHSMWSQVPPFSQPILETFFQPFRPVYSKIHSPKTFSASLRACFLQKSSAHNNDCETHIYIGPHSLLNPSRTTQIPGRIYVVVDLHKGLISCGPTSWPMAR